MADNSDTLTLDGFRRSRELPMVEAAAYNHPEAVSAARARIATLSETFPLETGTPVPQLATTKLVTDREQLRKSLTIEPVVVPTSRRLLPSIVQPVLTAVGIFLLILIVFKSPVILSQIKYTFHKTPAAGAAAVATTVISADPTITIPKINVSAPVVYEPSTDETAFETALQSGVVHYANTALPGQNGNVAIFGHSSNDWWQPGNYKFVFVLLDKLAPGDQITINYQSKRYTYEVTGSQVVDPTDVAVLNQTPTPTLSVITCTPPGTSWKRLVVTAKQIDPNPSAATVATTPAPTATAGLSSGSSGFGNQLSGLWTSLKSLFGAKPKTTTGATPQPNAPATLPDAN